MVSQFGKFEVRLQTGQSEPIRMRSAPKVSTVVSSHGVRFFNVACSGVGQLAMMPETLQVTLGSEAIFAKPSFQSLSLAGAISGPPQ